MIEVQLRLSALRKRFIERKRRCPRGVSVPKWWVPELAEQFVCSRAYPVIINGSLVSNGHEELRAIQCAIEQGLVTFYGMKVSVGDYPGIACYD